MARENRIQFAAGALLTLLAAVFFLAIFSLMSRTDRYSVYLWETATEKNGWRYEVLQDGAVTEVEPIFPDEWAARLPAERAEAVRMTRTMTEDLRMAEDEVIYPKITLEPYDSRVEVFMDGELLATDLSEGERDGNGFRVLTAADRQAMRQQYRSMTVSLPKDYLGRTLTIVVYYAEPRRDPTPPYPMLLTDDMEYAPFVVGVVPQTALLTLSALLTLLVLAVFAADARDGRADARMLLIALYFLLIFLDTAYRSTAWSCSVLFRRVNLAFLTGLYMVPLYLYFALLFTGWKRKVLSAAAIGWAVFEAVQMLMAVRRGDIYVTLSGNGLGAYLLLLLFAAAFALEYHFRRRGANRWRIPRFYLLTALLVLLGMLVYGSRPWGWNVPRYVRELVDSALSMFGPFLNCCLIVQFVTDTCAIMVVIVLLGSFLRRTVQARETVAVLEERSRLTLEGYERVLRAEEATGAVRHEMRHHMTALAGILRQGDTARAAEYVAAVSREVDRLPTVRYSANLMVDIICGSYLDRAQAEGVRVEYSLSVPARMAIADEDLSVFLSNMLENAVLACAKLPSERERSIRLKMNVHDDSLFIGCVNSAPEEQSTLGPEIETRAVGRHGYGLEAMRRIAEKYDSILVIERGGGTFSVRSNLHLRED